jgi:hypothetical protein
MLGVPTTKEDPVALPLPRIEYGTVTANGHITWPDEDGELGFDCAPGDEHDGYWRAYARPNADDMADVELILGSALEAHNEHAIVAVMKPSARGPMKLVKRRVELVIGATEAVS